MCGIIGYIGANNAVNYLIKGLEFLEYRGYDSSGVAVFDGKTIALRKKEGRVASLKNILGTHPISGRLGIGHTRWATHGNPCDENAHPFLSNDKSFAIVHNGIIENYLQLKTELIQKGYAFYSETDSEVIANLLQYYYNSDTETAILDTISRIKGSFAIGIIHNKSPYTLYAVKKDSPLIIGKSNQGSFICSDVLGIQNFIESGYSLMDEQIAKITQNSIIVKDFSNKVVDVKPIDFKKERHLLPKEYSTYMRKEIDEIPLSLNSAINSYLNCSIDKKIYTDIKRICFIGCGTALHSTLIAKSILRQISPYVDVYADTASEFVYMNYPIEGTLFIAVSQSGETADTLIAVRKIIKSGGKLISICNSPYSTLSRESKLCIFTDAGPEISVASTKAYNCQVAVLSAFCIDFAHKNHYISDIEKKLLFNDLISSCNLAYSALKNENIISTIASLYKNVSSVFYIGRGIDYFVAKEGSLKLKEISYIGSESYASGELKHGSLALIEKNSLVVAFITQPNLIDKMINNLIEVCSRGAKCIVITPFTNRNISSYCEYLLEIPLCNPLFSPILSVIPAQLIAYHFALSKGCDVDKPRNLAKSVTVE